MSHPLFHMLDAMSRQRAEEDIRDGIKTLRDEHGFDDEDIRRTIEAAAEEALDAEVTVGFRTNG